jgi:BirA family biotin operon repressor/biotin-[acetyl-CoA-carboxylase] ligase
VAPEDFLDRLAPALARWEAVLVAQGFAPLREAWLSRAAHLGRPLRARTGQAEHLGIFETVDLQGALVLQTAGGPLAIAAAEVFF